MARRRGTRIREIDTPEAAGEGRKRIPQKGESTATRTNQGMVRPDENLPSQGHSGSLPNSQPTISGITWHYSHPLERGIDVETEEKAAPEEVLKAITGTLRKARQDWEIKGMIATNIVDLVIPDLDGGSWGARVSQRAEDIAKANNWKLVNRGATWLGQHKSREFIEGKPTGLQISIISEVTPTEGVDRKYIVRGVEVPPRVFEWKRAPGTDREWFMQDNVRRYYSTTGPPPWALWINPKNCQRVRSQGMHPEPNQTLCFNCKQCHLTEAVTRRSEKTTRG